jgi:hypothetical protein
MAILTNLREINMMTGSKRKQLTWKNVKKNRSHLALVVGDAGTMQIPSIAAGGWARLLWYQIPNEDRLKFDGRCQKP